MSKAKGKIFIDHDLTHFNFGCDTCIFGEFLLKPWILLGCDISMNELKEYAAEPEVQKLNKEGVSMKQVYIVLSWFVGIAFWAFLAGMMFFISDNNGFSFGQHVFIGSLLLILLWLPSQMLTVMLVEKKLPRLFSGPEFDFGFCLFFSCTLVTFALVCTVALLVTRNSLYLGFVTMVVALVVGFIGNRLHKNHKDYYQPKLRDCHGNEVSRELVGDPTWSLNTVDYYDDWEQGESTGSRYYEGSIDVLDDLSGWTRSAPFVPDGRGRYTHYFRDYLVEGYEGEFDFGRYHGKGRLVLRGEVFDGYFEEGEFITTKREG